jgi:TonB family protein
VAMWINERGAVEWTAIEESSGFPQVDAIALDAFKDVVSFTPARSEGARIPVSVVISVPFSALW